MAIYTKAGLNRLTKKQLVDIVLEIQEEKDKLVKEGFRVKLNRVIETQKDKGRTVKVLCSVKVPHPTKVDGEGLPIVVKCNNPVEMLLTEARKTNGIVDCGNHGVKS